MCKRAVSVKCCGARACRACATKKVNLETVKLDFLSSGTVATVRTRYFLRVKLLSLDQEDSLQ